MPTVEQEDPEGLHLQPAGLEQEATGRRRGAELRARPQRVPVPGEQATRQGRGCSKAASLGRAGPEPDERGVGPRSEEPVLPDDLQQLLHQAPAPPPAQRIGEGR